MKQIIYIATILLVLGPAKIACAEGHYDHWMFVRAVMSESGSPGYALFQVRNAHTDSVQTVCVPGNSLVDAIQLEHNWRYAIGGRTKAKRIAVAHGKKPFVFETSNALAHVQRRYTEAQLTQIRSQLSHLTNSQLRSQLRHVSRHRRSEQPTELQKICASSNAPVSYGTRQAVAHVLLERGILVANDERSGQLRLP